MLEKRLATSNEGKEAEERRRRKMLCLCLSFSRRKYSRSNGKYILGKLKKSEPSFHHQKDLFSTEF